MATLNFPSNPTIGDIYEFEPYRYTWDGEKWKTIGIGYNPAAKLSPTVRSNIQRLAAEAGYNLVSGSFEDGGSLTTAVDVLWSQLEGKYYSWAGTFPKVVSAGSTPTTTGGVGAGAWVDRTQYVLRDEIGVIVKTFSTASAMIADSSLQVSDKCRIVGYSNIFDGGWNTFDIQSSGAADGGSVIALSNGLFAVGLFESMTVRPEQFGGSFISAKAFAKTKKYPLILTDGVVYDVGSSSVDVDIYDEEIIGEGAGAALRWSSAPTGYALRVVGKYPITNSSAYSERYKSARTVIKNVALIGNDTTPYSCVGFDVGDGTKVTSLFRVENLHISGFRWWGRFNDNSWGFTLDRLVTKHGGLITPTTPEDYGENISIITPFISDSVGEKIVFNKGEYFISGGSIDNVPIVTNNDSTVRWIGGHLENPGNTSTTTRYVECNDQSTFYAPSLNIVMNNPGANITEHWFYCEDGNINGIDLTGCTYVQHPFYRPETGSIPALSLVAGRGRVVCEYANISAFSNFNYIPVALNIRKSLANWDFENPYTVGWTKSGGATFVNDNVIFKSGLVSLKIIASSTLSGTLRGKLQCSSGDKVVGSYWIKGELAAGGLVYVQTHFYDIHDTLISTVSYASKSSTFDWECNRVGGIAPDGTNYAVVELGLNFTGSTGTVTAWFDGFVLNVL